MLLIYTPKVTPRLSYAFKHVCTRILGIPVKFTSKIEEFVAHEGMKLSYGKANLASEVFIQNVDLLLEQGLTDVEVKVQDWQGVPCFFGVSENSSIPFDIFAASFYLLSRYEEYLPHVKDTSGRFQAAESLAFQYGFLELPVIDLWAQMFRGVLKEKFPWYDFPQRSFESESVVAISEAFRYKEKGMIRVVFGLIRDIVRFSPKYVWHRIQVMLNLRKDPYDIYSKVIHFLKKHQASMKFMFQVSDFSAEDRNLNYNKLGLRSYIKSFADYAEVGLQPGYHANQVFEILKEEKTRLEDILKRPVLSVLNSQYNLLLPDTYNHLAALEIKNDYSMGYPQAVGFRAGTCTPFLFYDLNFETTTPLRLHPYALNTQALGTLKETEVEYKVLELKRQVMLVGGKLVSVFTNRDFSEYASAKRNFSILKKLHEV